ncbi:hypothetical protein NHX12_019782 [Muraenolepis orangiensis]|uniref:Uncharacterized protein n=1 Tax=Muraenolepis orangiensis TaxID=630683 RepID=A0A9Q0EXC5_9TELE|nr:hypothetical protein NHX12_019782 [Muraenolepis orangiensis]
MGSRESRPRPRQVGPVHGKQDQESEEQKKLGEPKPQWTLPALPVPAEQKKTSLLPPLKQTSEASPSTLAGNLPIALSNDPSTAQPRPPRRPQLRDRRGGGSRQYSTPREGGISQTQEGFLWAQGALQQQTYKHRRAQRRQAREHWRTQKKTVYTSNVGDPSREGGRLVRRPTERDIFWDEDRGGEGVDVHLLPPSPLPPLGKRHATRPG